MFPYLPDWPWYMWLVSTVVTLTGVGGMALGIIYLLGELSLRNSPPDDQDPNPEPEPEPSNKPDADHDPDNVVRLDFSVCYEVGRDGRSIPGDLRERDPEKFLRHMGVPQSRIDAAKERRHRRLGPGPDGGVRYEVVVRGDRKMS